MHPFPDCYPGRHNALEPLRRVTIPLKDLAPKRERLIVENMQLPARWRDDLLRDLCWRRCGTEQSKNANSRLKNCSDTHLKSPNKSRNRAQLAFHTIGKRAMLRVASAADLRLFRTGRAASLLKRRVCSQIRFPGNQTAP